jgi:hypothetical protein
MTRTPERDAEIVRMWGENMKATEIAQVLGLTKNTVIGAVDRAKKRGELPLYRENTNVPERCRLKHAAEVEALRVAKIEKQRQEAERAVRLQRLRVEIEAKAALMKAERERVMKEVAPKPPTSLWPQFDPDPPGLGGVSFKNLRQGQCKFPLEGRLYEGLTLFCGDPTVTVLSSWCAEHQRRCFSRVPLRPRENKPFMQLAGKGRERVR